MTQHLKETALEAAAHGRDDLLEAPERAHLDACAECRGQVAETRVLSNDASLALREALPFMEDLESLIAGALEKAPAAAVRPTTRALLFSALGAVAATLGLGLLSGASRLPTVSAVFASVRDTAAVLGAIDRVVTVAVPGGWSVVLLAGFLVLVAVAVPLRRLAARSAVVPTPGAGAVLGVFALLLSLSPWGGVAHALELEGEWPEQEASVSLSVERAPLGEVVRQAAEAAGLGYVATLPEEVSGREVTLHVRDASLRDVLEAVLGDAPVIARRTGTMLILSPGAPAHPESDPAAEPGSDPGAGPPSAVPVVPAVPAVPPLAGAVPAPPPVPSAAPARERVTFGEDVHIRPGERVREVVSMGGDVVVEGEVLRDVVTMGGDLIIKAGGIVHGAMVTMGGEVTIEEGGQHLGESVSMGVPFGSGRRGGPNVVVRGDDHDEDYGGGVRIGGWLEDALGSAAKHALLFLLGIILLGVAPARFNALKRTIAGSPFRSGGIGILGFIASILLVVVLTITLIGIPAAIVVALGAFLGAYVGLVASAAVVGAVLPWAALKDRPIFQLAVGLGIFYVISLIPGIGGIFALVATALGFGALLLTRFAPRAPGEA